VAGHFPPAFFESVFEVSAAGEEDDNREFGGCTNRKETSSFLQVKLRKKDSL
jgi:hypothetical protein